MVASCTPPTGDLTHNTGLCPDWELNHWPFGLQAGTQSSEPHPPGQKLLIIISFQEILVWLLKFPQDSILSTGLINWTDNYVLTRDIEVKNNLTMGRGEWGGDSEERGLQELL